MKTVYLLLIANCLYRSALAGRILSLLPHAGRSHFIVYEPLLRQLAERGHQVTVVSFFPSKNPPANYTDISLEGLAEIRLETVNVSGTDSGVSDVLFKFLPLNLKRTINQLYVGSYSEIIVNKCRKFIQHPPLAEALQQKYDLILLQNYVGNCMMGLLHVYENQAPIVTFISFSNSPWLYNLLGVNTNPSYVAGLTTYFTDVMTFAQRVANTLELIYWNIWHKYYIEEGEQRLLEEIAKRDVPPLNELNKNISLFLVNRFHELNGVRPLVPGIIEVGGIHLNKPRQKIPTFIENFLNESEHGVIVMSFGSVLKTSTLPKHKEDMIKRALSHLQERIIWKYEGSEEEGTLDGNILKVRWLPQYELLLHDKVVALIGHGGMASAMEAAAAGKPALLVPFRGDQYHNSAMAAEAGLAKVLPYDELTEHRLVSALSDILSEDMRKSAKRVSDMWKDRPSSPMDTAVYWVERSMRWGRASRLNAASVHLNWMQLALLDVAGFLVLVLAVVLLSCVWIARKVVRCLLRKRKEKVH